MASAPRARLSVATIFFVNGVVLASWVPHIPALKTWHGIGDGQLGLVLLAMAVGAVLALPFAGWLVARFGSRRMTTLAALSLCAALPLPVLSPAVPALVASLVLLGACNGTLDVSMNAQAVLVEREYGHAIMSSFHGLFSLGGLVGAAVSGVALSLGVPPAWHVVATAGVCSVAVGGVLGGLFPPCAVREQRGPVFARPTGVLLGLGILAFFGLVAEGAMGDWSAVYLRDALHTSPGFAAWGFAAFSLAMAAGRFGGDRLVRRSGAVFVVRSSAAVAALGLGGALVVGEPHVAIVGCGLVGLGISNIIPVLFSRAGRIRGVEPGTALAAVASTGYLGFLAGPPLIGLTAELAGLPVALGLVSVFCAVIAIGAGHVEREVPVGITLAVSPPRP